MASTFSSSNLRPNDLETYRSTVVHHGIVCRGDHASVSKGASGSVTATAGREEEITSLPVLAVEVVHGQVRLFLQIHGLVRLGDGYDGHAVVERVGYAGVLCAKKSVTRSI